MEREFPYKVVIEEKGGLIRRIRLEGGSGVQESEAYELDWSSVTPFERLVYEVLLDLGVGETMTYGEVARRVGNPRAARAIGNACKRNPFPLVVPCHRVVASHGIGGFAYGTASKRALLAFEGVAL